MEVYLNQHCGDHDEIFSEEIRMQDVTKVERDLRLSHLMLIYLKLHANQSSAQLSQG